jgi:transcriptional regulator
MYVPSHFAETRIEVLHGLIERHPLGALVRLDGERPGRRPHPVRAGRRPPLMRRMASCARTWRVRIRCGARMALRCWRSSRVRPAMSRPRSTTCRRSRAARSRPGTTRSCMCTDGCARRRRRLAAGPHAQDDAAPGIENRVHRPRLERRRRAARLHRALVRATVGIEIVIERLEGKWKASQNRSAEERARICPGEAAWRHRELILYWTSRRAAAQNGMLF